MTQQNETQQPGAAEPGQPAPLPAAAPASAAPTPGAPPALYGYESVPEAYLAPPQPGQPRYGAAPYPRVGRAFGGRPGYGEPGSGQPGRGQPGYGQPGGGQPGYGRSAPARPAYGLAARRDPALAPPWQRLVAQTIDWIIIIVVSVLVFWSQVSVFYHEVQAIMGRYASTPTGQAAIDSIARNPVIQHARLYWFLGMIGLALVYFWVQLAASGATIGQRVMGIRVVRASDRSRVGVLTAGIRTLAFLLGPALYLLLVSLFGVIGAVLWAADGGLTLLDGRAQALHDKVAGTVVVRQRALDEARRSSAW